MTRVVDPPDLPLSIDDLKARSRISPDMLDEDQLLDGFIRAATEAVERDTGIVFLTQTWDVSFDEWKGGWGALLLPWRPLQSVTSISSTDSAGVTTAWAGTNYRAELGTIPSRIVLADNVTWPGDIRLSLAWTIRIVVGHTNVEQIDPLLVHAVGLLATHYAGPDGRDGRAAPDGYEEIIGRYRWRNVA
jgi:uncharacterized phiE125 gp8 family phage protein